MESVESIAAKIAHEDLVYLDYSPPVYQQVDRMALERAIAAALTAERERVAELTKEAARGKSLSERHWTCMKCGGSWNCDRADVPKVNGASTPVIPCPFCQLTAERAKFAAFAGPDGEPRKVLGTLPVTADGCIAGDGAVGYTKTGMATTFYVTGTPGVDSYFTSGKRPPLPHRWFSTKQAAEAAAGGKK